MIDWRKDGNAEENGEKAKELLCVGVGKVCLGMELLNISEIIREWSVTPLPLVPEYFEGVFSWKGLIVPLVSLPKLAGITAIPQAEPSDGESSREAVVTLRAGEMECAFVVPEEPRLLAVRESERLQGGVPDFFGDLIVIKKVYACERQTIYVLDAEATLKNLALCI